MRGGNEDDRGLGWEGDGDPRLDRPAEGAVRGDHADGEGRKGDLCGLQRPAERGEENDSSPKEGEK